MKTKAKTNAKKIPKITMGMKVGVRLPDGWYAGEVVYLGLGGFFKVQYCGLNQPISCYRRDFGRTWRLPRPEQIRTFASDHRSNPGLHNLYVRGAYEDLKIVKACLDELAARSRVPADIMAGALHEAMRKEIESDAAFFEAAALLFTGLEPPKETES